MQCWWAHIFLAYWDLGRFGGCIGIWAEYSKDMIFRVSSDNVFLRVKFNSMIEWFFFLATSMIECLVGGYLFIFGNPESCVYILLNALATVSN